MPGRGWWLAARTRGPGPLGPEHATDLDVAMMDAALAQARLAAKAGEVPVGAAVYDPATGAILARDRNRREKDRAPEAHAEFLAILAAAKAVGDWRLNHLALAVTLEPCSMCAGLIVNARLGRVVFGCRDPKAGACGSLYRLTADPRLNHRVRPIEGVRADESARLLREFFKARRAR